MTHQKPECAEILNLLQEAQSSFKYAQMPGYSAENWHLNASLCVDKAYAILQVIAHERNEDDGR